MLINQKPNDINFEHVEFISYTGKWPSLCMGILTLKIDGKEVHFGRDFYNKETENNYSKFWESGGNCYIDGCMGGGTNKGEWRIDVQQIPEEFRKYAFEIDALINENIPFGCCGGCL